MSNIFYKFKSAKDYDTLAFDGTGISVFDLKKEIITAKKLGKGLDFDLAIYHAQTNEEYEDDGKVIPRNTQILVQRKPPSGKQGTAQRYISGAAPVYTAGSRAITAGPNAGQGSTFPPQSGKHIFHNQPMSFVAETASVPIDTSNMNEEERIEAMFKQSEDYWRGQERVMQHQRPIMRPRLPNSTAQGAKPYQPREPTLYDDMPSREPPSGYICYRCGQRGHFINQCPTLGDVAFDNRPRFIRTTGIPRSFLATVENRDDTVSAAMVTESGEFVYAKPNEEAWNRMSSLMASIGNTSDIIDFPDHLKCGYCDKLLRNPVMVPCCQSIFCDRCIRHSLLDNEDQKMRLKCPGCLKDQYPDNLQTSRDIKSELDAFIKSHFDNLKALALASVKAVNTSTQPVSEDEPLTKKQKVFRFVGDKKGYSRPIRASNAIQSHMSDIPAAYKAPVYHTRSSHQVSETQSEIVKSESVIQSIQSISPMRSPPLPASREVPTSQPQSQPQNRSTPTQSNQFTGFNPMQMNPMLMQNNFYPMQMPQMPIGFNPMQMQNTFNPQQMNQMNQMQQGFKPMPFPGFMFPPTFPMNGMFAGSSMSGQRTSNNVQKTVKKDVKESGEIDDPRNK